MLVYYTTTDPDTFATEPTLGIGTNAATVTAGGRVTITVRQYDDAGNKSAAAGAWILVNGRQRVQTRHDGRGHGAAGQARAVPHQGDEGRHHPLAEAVDHRHLLLVALALVAAGCGQGASQPPAGPDAATVLVTRDFGSTTLTRPGRRPASPRSTPCAARPRSARATAGGSSNRSTASRARRARRGLALLRQRHRPRRRRRRHPLHAGRPRVVGLPVLEGLHRRAGGDRRLAGAVRARPRRQAPAGAGARGPACAGQLSDALERAGARVGDGTAPFDVRVATFDEVSPLLDRLGALGVHRSAGGRQGRDLPRPARLERRAGRARGDRGALPRRHPRAHVRDARGRATAARRRARPRTRSPRIRPRSPTRTRSRSTRTAPSWRSAGRR